MTARERPILFSAPMVRAILAGAKTVTRRIVTVRDFQATHISDDYYDWMYRDRAARWHSVTREQFLASKLNRFGQCGDTLWVRETWCFADPDPGMHQSTEPGEWRPRGPGGAWAYYRATDDDVISVGGGFCGPNRSPWRPGIHMPRWASRVTLEVVDVRVERLYDVTEDDAKREGVEPYHFTRAVYPSKLAARVDELSYREGFHSLWDAINGKRASWASNPFVWRVEFKRVQP